ncbi:hypothetical protein SEA_ZETA1847_73 [Microbacterium phage Zeta1847]|uniref:Uncharacterized protein n=1 Tax=Microbacterium phage Zeta1847 TaxID=2201444 RepID=A0A2Z4Q9N0_9CAUD|nr:hypothetical protein HOT46_gp73 [Microbacterium phage Zeta1847]AWY06707.1 hypothetical protein SEA_ZETA1847_73 [Microbacterium phage Zeta1847]
MRPVTPCPDRRCPVRHADTAAPREGDLVSATKGETALVGRVAKCTRMLPRRLYTSEGPTECTELVVGVTGPTAGPTLETLRRNGFELVVLERAPELPTEPGVYVDRTGDVWRIFAEGEPLKCLSTSGDMGDVDPANWAPFTKLVKAGE